MTQPAIAKTAGFNVNTYGSSFPAAEVDLARAYPSTAMWYMWDWQNGHAEANRVRINDFGGVTLLGDAVPQLASAAPANNANGYTGFAFGGGAYVEATLSFKPQDVINRGYAGFPAFWALPLERLANVGATDQWPGQAFGYKHFAEIDILQYNLNGRPSSYTANLHDWYGQRTPLATSTLSDSSLPSASAIRSLSPPPNFELPHRYGFLWVPATSQSRGSAAFYFDGVQIGPTTYWDQLLSRHAPPPTGQPWQFGVLDRQHIVLILGTGPNMPMIVKDVNVWQHSADFNMKHRG